MKRGGFLYVVLFMILISCISEQKKEKRADSIADENFNNIDLSYPDSYPQFEGCEELGDLKTCFYESLHLEIHEKLQEQTLDINLEKSDTITAIIRVSNKGAVSYVSLENKSEYTAIDSLLRSRLINLSQVKPALKHGVPVESSYMLPIVLHPSMD